MPDPAATVVLNTYQQVRYAPLALRSVLAQDCEPIHILVSDDASTDGTFESLERMAAEYTGPHTLTLRRNEVNLGPSHMPLLLTLVTTRLVIRAHGDDLSRPDRVQRLLAEWRRTSAPLIGSNALQIDEEGRPGDRYRQGPVAALDAKTLITHGFRPEFLGATLAFERRLIEAPLGMPDQKQVFGGLDVILPVRAALLGGCGYIDEPLIEYRRHAGQTSWQIADKTKDRAVLNESLRAHAIPYRLQAIRDLQALRRAHPKRRDLESLNTVAIEALFAEMQLWSGLRVELLGRGLRPSWITREERAAATRAGR